MQTPLDKLRKEQVQTPLDKLRKKRVQAPLYKLRKKQVQAPLDKLRKKNSFLEALLAYISFSLALFNIQPCNEIEEL